MKNYLPFIFSLILLAACSQKSEKPRDIQLLTEPATYTNQNMYSDTAAVNEKTVAQEPVKETVKEAPKTRVITKVIYREPANTGTVAKAPVVQNTPVKSEVPETSTPPITTSTTPQNNGETVSTGDNSTAGLPGETVEKNKGWSKAAQGAVIGGAVGAVGGAILSKKKGLGAVVGGVVGAAGGYILGKNKDKKEAAKTKFDF